MSLQSTPRLALPYLVAGQAQKEITHNEALVLVDAAIGAAAESALVDTPPSAPASGQCWIVGALPTGAWSGQAQALAVWTEGGWRFLPVHEGMTVWVKDRQLWARRGATSWLIGAAAVPLPTGGSIIDTEARAAVGAIIARLVAQGLIDA